MPASRGPRILFYVERDASEGTPLMPRTKLLMPRTKLHGDRLGESVAVDRSGRVPAAIAPGGPLATSDTAGVPLVVGGIVRRFALFDRLGRAGRVTAVAAPAGSGKTLLLRSWIQQVGVGSGAAWVSVRREERDPQRFWVSVVDALRATSVGAALVGPLTAAPELDGWAVVERLLEDLAGLERRVWLVIDDVHELRSTEALRQLELFLLLAPDELRFVLATRHDLGLGLHRLRLEGALTEIRAADLRFSGVEAGALLEAAGVALSEPVLGRLVARTEGWAAGLRLAALSLAGHPEPEWFANEFSGGARTVAEYLLAEVLDRQPEPVRRLLLRTSVLERVSGPLADALTGDAGGERILQDLERANAFVVSLDPGRWWFRYHQLLADLLQLELRRTAPDELPGLHAAAVDWYAEHGYPVDAVRHAQAAGAWDVAARLLFDHWIELVLDGQAATAHELLAAFPAEIVAADAELAALVASDEVIRGSLDEAERHLDRAATGVASVSSERRSRFEIRLGVLRLWHARQRGDLPAVMEEAQRLLAPAGESDAARLGLDDDLRAFVLISLGIAESWTQLALAGWCQRRDRIEEAERHLEAGVALARRIERPYLEVLGLAHSAFVARFRSFALAEQRSSRAIELARRHGWSEEPAVAPAYLALGGTKLWQGRLAESGRWLGHAERSLQVEVEPASGRALHHFRALLEMARGRDEEALDAFRAGGRLAKLMGPMPEFAVSTRAGLLRTLVRLGDIDRVERAFVDMGEQERETAPMRLALAVLRLAQGDPRPATIALAPIVDGSADVLNLPGWGVQALLLEATARDALGDPGGTDRALERALDLAERDSVRLPFLLDPAPGLLKRHARDCPVHAALIDEILSLMDGRESPPSPSVSESFREPLSESETRVLRYLPTNLTAPEIAAELFLSVNTVKTHMRHLYDKLGAHRRAEAVARARALGVLAPSLGKRAG